MSESILRTDILPEDLKKSQQRIQVEAESIYSNIVRTGIERTKSPRQSKNIIETMELIEEAIRDYEQREHAIEDSKVSILYENPDKDAQLEAISIQLTKRQPGSFSQGRPFEGEVKQLRPVIREEGEDTENPGYKRAVLGYCYDNILTLTCWARTNKSANARALWLENVMEEYSWFFSYSGVNRAVYQGRQKEKIETINGNKIYGRPIDYYIRTEKLRSVSQKTLEEICIKYSLRPV